MHHADSRTRPALRVLIDDYSRYHVAMVVLAATVAIAVICLGVVLWLKFARTTRSDGRSRLVFGSVGALAVPVFLATVVVTVANATTVADPGPGLLAFFNGSW